MFQYILPTWSECLTMYCLHGQSVSHIMPMWSECHHILVWSERCHILRWSECHHILVWSARCHILRWSECIPHNAHVVRVSHNMLYQSMLSTWSVCFSIYRPCGQSVSHIMPTWSECITMRCLHGQYVSVCIAHVVRVYPT